MVYVTGTTTMAKRFTVFVFLLFFFSFLFFFFLFFLHFFLLLHFYSFLDSKCCLRFLEFADYLPQHKKG